MKTMVGAKSHFSAGSSILKPADLISDAKKNGYECVAVADQMNINAMTMLSGAAKKAGLKLVVGAAIRVVDDIHWRKAGRSEPKAKPNPFFVVKLFVKNEDGLRDLMDLLSLGYCEPRFYFEAQVGLDDLISAMIRGNLVLTTGDADSVFSHRDHSQILQKIIEASRSADVVTELVSAKTAYYDRVTQTALAWELKNRPEDMNIIYSAPALHREGDHDLRDTLDCIMSRNKVDSVFARRPGKSLFAKTPEDLSKALLIQLGRIKELGGIESSAFPEIFAAATSGLDGFSDRFQYTWEKMPISLPVMSEDPFMALVGLCKKGWKDRLLVQTLGYAPTADQIPEYKDRLKYELGVLRAMGFENYFLLVYKLVNWCKESEIMCGPGRGSVGGSLVAYLLGITDVDPIRFGLIFERFINPDRLDLPDIDLDFMSSRRDEVIDYLINEFGSDHVAGISNYGVLGGSSSLRAVASAHNLHETDYSCSKQVPKESGQSIDLEEALALVPDIDKFAKAHPEIWKQSCGLQGVFRNYGKHAAGVIVAGDKISNRAVINGREKYKIVNWDKRVVEDFGLVKLDVLGLQTLDLLHLARDYVKDTTGEVVTYTSVSLDDPDIMRAFGEGDTTGVFQFEGGGMKHLLKELAVAGDMTFNEVTAATALFRPGPLEAGLTEAYVQIRQGARLPNYVHPSVEPALKETYSVIVYQESVMQVARDLAGFTMAEADKLRKAMGKKSPEEMAAMREKFVTGCQSVSGISESSSTELFDQIEMFAGYAFNKSHSVEYTILSYWSMYMKVKHPAEFFAAALTILDEDKRPALVRRAEESGVIVMPPDINLSTARFEIVEKDGKKLLYSPFQMIKGMSDKASEAIMKAREAAGGVFKSKAEFIAVVNKRLCNSRSQDYLDRVGSFASIEDQLPALDSSRLKDQKMMLPGLMSANVVVDRKPTWTEPNMKKLEEILRDVSLAGAVLQDEINATRQKLDPEAARKSCVHPKPYFGVTNEIMIIMDIPNWTEIQSGTMSDGLACNSLHTALKESGIEDERVYVTSLVKCGKDKEEVISNAMINAYSPFLDKEIALVNPPVIVCLGSKAIRHLMPDVKGGWEELCGQIHYHPGLDATICFGLNPSMIHFEPTRQRLLTDVMIAAKNSLG